jgi:hypothetical protein
LESQLLDPRDIDLEMGISFPKDKAKLNEPKGK